VKKAACSSSDIQVLGIMSPGVQQRPSELGIKSVPTLAIDGKLALEKHQGSNGRFG
jgi:hypothetical protein